MSDLKDLDQMLEESQHNYILLYDGTCNLCNFWVRNLKRFDKNDKLDLFDINIIVFSMLNEINCS